MHDPYDNDPEQPEDAEGPSRSELKRQAHDRQVLIGRLLELSDGEWQQLGFDDWSRKAMAEGKRIKASSARNRQVRFLAKRLDDGPLDNGAAYLDNRRSLQLEANRAFHALERWRDRLIAEGDPAVSELLAEYPHIDRQQLRSQMRAAQKERREGKPVGAAKKLFRLLREAAGD